MGGRDLSLDAVVVWRSWGSRDWEPDEDFRVEGLRFRVRVSKRPLHSGICLTLSRASSYHDLG